MPSKQTVTKEPEPKVDLIKARTTGLTLLSPLEKRLATLEVKTEADYAIADALLGDVNRAEKLWLDGDGTKEHPGIDKPIESIRSGLDLLYDLKNSVWKPLKEMKAGIKAKMVAFKEEERRLIREAEEARIAEANRLLREAEALKAKEEAAKTNARKNEIIAKRAEVEQKAAEVQQAPAYEAVKGTKSAARYPLKCRVTDLGLLLEHILNADTDLSSLVEINMGELEALRRLQNPPVPIGKWMPGVEVYEDIQIAGRGGK